MTTAIAADLPAARRLRPAVGPRYGRMWARVPRELGYLALTTLIGLVVFNLARGVLAVSDGGAALAVVLVLLLAVLMIGSRYLGAFDLKRLRWARTPPITPPTWLRPFHGRSPLRVLGDVYGNWYYWLSLLHSALVSPLLAIGTATVWFGWLAVGLAGATFPAWGLPPVFGGLADPTSHPTAAAVLVGNPSIAQLAIRAVEGGTGAVDPARAAWLAAGVSALGLLMLAVFPFVTRGATLAHWGAARLLLARSRSEDLRSDVARVDAARRAAVAAEDTALRRLERDIHDGPQQRLLRLQMELATAERRLTGDPAAAVESIDAARRLARETLDELRALAQGFAPPLLQDRGLAAALVALGSRTGTPVETRIALPADLPAEVERSVYFVVAELTSNAMKHASARGITIDARVERAGATPELRVAVTDDGVGGARTVPGRGLSGAAERLAGLGGTLEVSSPAGGPTVATLAVPLP